MSKETAVINCENSMCVYYKKGECVLESISIDSLGMCTECVHVTIEEEVVENKRKEQLKEFEFSFGKF